MHRDVKLENLQFGGDGGLRIVDFGLVRDLREEEHQNLTQTGVFLGTPWGIAPEQAKDPRAVDDRADVYSLGCVLYQLLSGKAPFSTTHRLELVAAHLRDTPPEVPGLAEPLRALLTRMLDKAREKRPSADDVANALEKYLQAPPAAAPPSRWARGLWALVALFFVCAAVLMFRVREGTIVIEGIPEHAEVFVDGDRATVRLRPDGKSFEIRAVPGKRRVEVRTGDVVVYGKELDVALGRGDPIRVRIEPPAAPVPPVVPPVAPPMPDVPLPTPPEPLDDGGFVQLFNGKNLDGWKAFLKGEKADPATTFFVANGQIQATGALGYLFTTNSYKNYVLRYRWAFPKDLSEKTSMNSGLLMHIQEPHKVWPHSVEVQGRHQDHGKLFFIGLALNGKASQKFDENAQKKALKAPHEWQTTEVTSQDGKIEVRLNGTLVATGESPLTSGPIGFQSEGARIFFKDIQIKIADDGSGAGAPGPTPYKIDDFVAGAVWKGWRDYEEGAYAPKKVPYELHIRKRTGDTFVGHTFNNGPNRNHAEVTG